MNESAVLEIATRELTGAVNQIAQAHNITPSLMRFVMSAVSNRLNEMAVTELSEEVIEMKLKIGEPQSKTDEEPSMGKVEEVKSEKASDASHTKSVKKSGTLDELIADLKASGVKVTETRKSVDSTGKVTVEEVVDEPSENKEEKK